MRMESIWLTPSLHQQFIRMKMLGGFQNDQEMIRAAFNAWERTTDGPAPVVDRYMSRPGLSPDDYDT